MWALTAASRLVGMERNEVNEQHERLSLGDFIATQRRAAEMSLRQLADRAGISNPYVSQIERGLRKPSAEVLNQIATALSVSAESLYVRAGIIERIAFFAAGLLLILALPLTDEIGFVLGLALIGWQIVRFRAHKAKAQPA